MVKTAFFQKQIKKQTYEKNINDHFCCVYGKF